MAWGSDYSEAEDVRANNPSDAPTQVARSTLDDLFVGERQGNHINGVRPMAAYVHRVRLAQLQIAGQATQKSSFGTLRIHAWRHFAYKQRV